MSSKDAKSNKLPGETPIPTPPVSEAEIDALLQQVPKFRGQLEEVCREHLAKSGKDVAEEVMGGHRLAWATTIGMLRRFERKTVVVPKHKEAELTHRMVLAISFLQGIS